MLTEGWGKELCYPRIVLGTNMKENLCPEEHILYEICNKTQFFCVPVTLKSENMKCGNKECV